MTTGKKNLFSNNENILQHGKADLPGGESPELKLLKEKGEKIRE